MGSPLGPVLVNIFMVELESILYVINSFQFTYQQKNNSRFPFLMFYLLGMMRKETPPSLGKTYSMIFIYTRIHFHQLAGNEGH